MSKDKSVIFVGADNGIWIEYNPWDRDNIKKYVVVSESISGFPILKSIDSSKTIYKALGPQHVLVKKKSLTYIETDGQIDLKGSWLKERKKFFFRIFKLDKSSNSYFIAYCRKSSKCTVNACTLAESWCPANPRAICIADHCKGCQSTKWFDKDVLIDCKSISYLILYTL